MNIKKFKVQEIICAFFMITCCLTFNSLIIHGEEEEYKPNETINIPGTRTELYEEGRLLGHATVQYTMHLTDHDSKTNKAYYNVTSSYYLEGETKLYGDALWINGEHVGDFISNSGHRYTTQTIHRTETLRITLHSGMNTFETTNIDGIGGNTTDTIVVRTFSSPPKVHATNGVWYEGEVAKGLRTWESIYTDGATGDRQKNKIQTATGFLYSDVDEQVAKVNAYHDSVIGSNSTITEIKNVKTGAKLPLYSVSALNNPGTYLVTSKTTDSSGLTGEASRYITVQERKYNIKYNGNGATSGNTSSQVCTVLYDCALNANGFKKQYSVSYNGNGGTPTKSSDVANATFLYWNNGSKTYANKAVVKDLSTTHGATITMNANWKNGAVTLPNATKSGYKFMGWYTSSSGGSKVGGNGSSYTPSGNTTIYARWDKAPIINAENQTFYEGQYSDATWKNTQRLKGVSASDQEDGNITSKIKIIEDTTKVDTPGTYRVTYQVSDKVGQIAKKTVTITVKFNNPPVIVTKDKSFYEGQYTKDQWIKTLRMQSITASDKEDGNLTAKLMVIADTVNVNKAGVYKVTYQVTDKFGKTTKKDAKVTVLYNNPPVITTKDKSFYEGQYTKQEWINSLRMKDISASDIEDGSLTAKIKVISDTVDVTKAGNYKVTYQVVDAFGKSATATSKVTVLFNNPPKIEGGDRWFYVSDDITNAILLERVKATDIEDGDISSKATIIQSNVVQHVVGEYKVQYQVIDAFGKSAKTTVKVHIVENMVSGTQAKRLRFISNSYLSTLQEDSIWKTTPYRDLLTGTFAKTESTYDAKVTLTKEDMDRIRSFNDQNDYSTRSNQAFYEQFQYLWEGGE